jgi:hypothetical protein
MHQQSIHRATNIAAEVRDEIRGTKIADSGVQLDETRLSRRAPDNIDD